MHINVRHRQTSSRRTIKPTRGGRNLPKQTTCVCNDQLDSFAVAELPDMLLLVQSRVRQHYHLGCKNI